MFILKNRTIGSRTLLSMTANNTPVNTGGVSTNQQGQATVGADALPNSFLPSLNGFSASPPSALHASDSADSTTVSGISYGSITISNNAAQTALTGNGAATTVAAVNRDVQTQFNTTTDAQGNAVTTAIAVDSQGNYLGNTLTPIFNDETKANINAGFAITQAFTGQVGTFLSNRSRESTEAQQAIENELKKPESQQDLNVIAQAAQVLANNQMWSMGGTGRIALTAITAAFSGNVTGSGSALIQSATITALQSLGAQQIKALAEQLGGEGSIAHTALHAVLACAGAAATGGDCGTGALAASSGVVLNSLINQLEGKDASQLTPTEREARLNLLTTLVTGVTAAVGGNAAVANTAAQIETENNAILLQQLFGISSVTTRFIASCALSVQLCTPEQYTALKAKDFAQNIRIAELVKDNLIIDGHETFEGIMNLSATIAYLAEHPEKLKDLPDGIKAAFTAAIKELKLTASDVALGNFIDSPEWYERQAKAEAAVFTAAAEALIGEGVGAAFIRGSTVVIRSINEIKTFLRVPDITRLTKIDIDTRSINNAILNEHGVNIEVNLDAQKWQAELVTKEGKPEFNNQTGKLREDIAKTYFDTKDYTALDGSCGSNCFDGVFINNKTGELIIVEVKPLTSSGIKLSPANGPLPAQMTDQWIVNAAGRIEKLAESGSSSAQLTINKLNQFKDPVTGLYNVQKVVIGVNSQAVKLITLR